VTTVTAGQCLAGRYQLTSLIAMGGMGEIWCAQDQVLGRDVAVKVLRPHLADPAAADRLRAEARVAAMLNSERVVRVHDSGEFTDTSGRAAPFLVMELVRGRSLGEQLAEDPQLSAGRVTVVVRQVAEALAEAHDIGLVHRDVKPANVLVLPNGDCKVTDFGISSHTETDGLTATGLVMGTARYLSPEQVNGLRATSASDIYSLGVLAHELLRGQRLYDADSEIGNALAHVQQTPPPLPDSVPAPLAALVAAMLSKDPSLRPEARGVIAALGSTPDSETAVLVLPTQPASRTKWWAAVAGVAAVAGLGVALTGSGGAGSAPSPQRPPQQSSDVATHAPASPTPTKAPVVIPAARVTVPTTAAAPAKKHRKGHH
jgi:serine/threonine protein kinase